MTPYKSQFTESTSSVKQNLEDAFNSLHKACDQLKDSEAPKDRELYFVLKKMTHQLELYKK